MEVESLPKKAGGVPSGISMSSRKGRAKALGLLNILFHPYLASAGVVHLYSSSHPARCLEGGHRSLLSIYRIPKTDVPASPRVSSP